MHTQTTDPPRLELYSCREPAVLERPAEVGTNHTPLIPLSTGQSWRREISERMFRMELGLSATRARILHEPSSVRSYTNQVRWRRQGGRCCRSVHSSRQRRVVTPSAITRALRPYEGSGPIQGEPIGTSSSFKPTRYHPNESSCGSMLEITCGGRSTVGNLWKKINQSFRGIVPEVCCEIMKIGMV